MSSNDELSSNTSSSCDVESLQLAVEGEGSFNSIVQLALSSRVVELRRRRVGERRGRRRWYTLCDLRISRRLDLELESHGDFQDLAGLPGI